MKLALSLAAAGLAIAGTMANASAAPVSSRSVYDPVGLITRAAAAYDFQYQYFSFPPLEDLEAMLVVDSRFWAGYRYIRRSLGPMTLLDGSPSSGTFSVSGNYTYYSEFTERNWREWVIFRFTNGNFNCVVYQSRSRTCRRIPGFP